MTAHHANIALNRTYRHSADDVFNAWSRPEILLQWALPGGGWVSRLERFEFAPGGEQVSVFGPPGDGERFVNRSRFHDIVPGARIVSSGSLSDGGDLMFVGVLSIEFQAEAAGCRLRLNEQGVYLDGRDTPDRHEGGWREMLEQLGLYLRGEPFAADRRDGAAAE